MKYLALLLLVIALPAGAVVRTLSGDCSIPGRFTPSESTPFDLDNCTLRDGDDITTLLKDVAARWGDVYVRAPSKTVWVYAGYTVWTANNFYFIEDQSRSNAMLIRHKVTDAETCIGTACNGFWVLWHLENFDNVKIGGPNLGITFQGNHPGLANCTAHARPAAQIGWNAAAAEICDINKGLVEFSMTDGTQATLADVRASFRFAQQYALYTNGDGAGEGVTKNTILKLNVAGVFHATGGIFFHTGVKNAWADPDRTVLSDPYARAWGWDGTAPGKTQGGLPMGCNDRDNNQARLSSFSGYYTDSVSGGITIEYGGYGSAQRFTRNVGSAEVPFIIRIKDLGITGPGTLYPAGVRPKALGESTFFKGDPHDAGGESMRRYLRLIKLPSTYGDGSSNLSLTGCAKDNNWPSATSNFLRFENSISDTRYTRGWRVEFAGDWGSPGDTGNFVRGELVRFAFDPYRSYDNWLIAASSTTINDTLRLHDTDTVTGPGTFTNLQVSDFNANNPGRNNTIRDTNVSGTVTIDASTENTTIRNVNFTGTARAIITVGSGSSATVDGLCAPNNSTITVASGGTLVYEGTTYTANHTITPAANNCSIDPNGRPNPPGAA